MGQDSTPDVASCWEVAARSRSPAIGFETRSSHCDNIKDRLLSEPVSDPDRLRVSDPDLTKAVCSKTVAHLPYLRRPAMYFARMSARGCEPSLARGDSRWQQR